jgi:hypothetical protein
MGHHIKKDPKKEGLIKRKANKKILSKKKKKKNHPNLGSLSVHTQTPNGKLKRNRKNGSLAKNKTRNCQSRT